MKETGLPTYAQMKALDERIDMLMRSPDAGDKWAEICRLQAIYRDNMALIRADYDLSQQHR